jgi:putative flippase GtrA
MAYGHAAAHPVQRPGAAVLTLTAERLVDDGLKRSLKQFVKFCFVGATGVIVNLAVFAAILLLWLALTGHIHSMSELVSSIRSLVFKKDTHGIPAAVAYIANAAGFVVSVLTNYYLNRRWTFRSSGEVRSELPKFFTVSVIAYVVQLAIFWTLRTPLHLALFQAQVIAIACVMPINFVLNKLWSFKGA